MKTWQLQHAKSHFSEVVRSAIKDGPQHITMRGELVAVLISKEEYEHLAKPKSNFVEFMMRSPLVGAKLIIKRDKSPNREIDL